MRSRTAASPTSAACGIDARRLRNGIQTDVSAYRARSLLGSYQNGARPIAEAFSTTFIVKLLDGGAVFIHSEIIIITKRQFVWRRNMSIKSLQGHKGGFT